MTTEASPGTITGTTTGTTAHTTLTRRASSELTPDEFTDPPLRATVAAEWMKLRAMRSTWVLFSVGIVLGVAVAALLALAVGATWDDWSADDRADFNPVISPLVGSIFSGVLIVALGVKAGGCEYAGGLSRLTLVATPRRGRVLAAKCVVVTLVTWTASAVAMVGMFVSAQLVFGAFDVTTAGFGDGDVVRAVATAVALSPLFPLFGLALAILFRSAAGAVSAVLAMLFGPEVVGSLLPPWWQENVIAYLPGAASDSVAYSHVDDTTAYLPVGAAVAVVAVWLAVFVGAAYRALTSRDA